MAPTILPLTIKRSVSMATKSTLSLLAAVISLSFGTAYAFRDAGDPAVPGATTPQPEEQSTERSLTKKDALANGVPEEIFNMADTNKDDKLDAEEITAYNEKVSKKR